MNSWEKKISVDPQQEFSNVVQFYSKEEKLNIISGLNPSFTTVWTPLQCLLFWGPLQYQKLMFQLLEEGANPNIYSKKGINFYHLFFTLMFYRKDFQTKEVFNIFMETLKFGFQPNFLIILSFRKVYLPIDFFQQLLENKISNISFLKNKIIPFTDFEYIPLEDNKQYFQIMFTFFCNDTYEPKNYCELQFLRENNIKNFLEFDIFKQFVIRYFKIPKNLSQTQIDERIQFMSSKKDVLTKTLLDFNALYPFDKNPSLRDELYFNPDLIETNFLKSTEFLSPICERNKNYHFHHNYYPILLKQKINPYSRQEISIHTLSLWKKELSKQYLFPIQSLNEQDENEIFLFPIKKLHQQTKMQKMFDFLEQFFQFYHPYNQIRNIQHFKPYELQYLAHVLVHDSKYLQRFENVITRPTLQVCFQHLLFYVRKGVKYINMIFFFSEEILQDLQCFSKIESKIPSLDENAEELWDQYYSRYSTFHPALMRKFLEQMLIIEKYKNSYNKT